MVVLKILKKTDIILLLSVLCVCGALFFGIPAMRSAGKTVTVWKNNKIYGSYPLAQNATVDLGGNTVVIKNGSVKMESATCPLGICRKHSAISKKGENIICLPHKVVVEIG